MVTELSTTAATWTSLRLLHVILVSDGASPDTQRAVHELGADPLVTAIDREVSLGQHRALRCGLRSSSADLVVTMDEDGEHDPTVIPLLAEQAALRHHDLVYLCPRKRRGVTGLGAVLARRWARRKTGGTMADFSSFRLLTAELARAVAGDSTDYLDVSLQRASRSTGHVPGAFRPSRLTGSSYGATERLAHFLRLRRSLAEMS